MHRRAFLTATAAAATAATLKSAQAVTERPYGATGVPLPARPPQPLGPLPGSRYPDPHIESLDKRFKGSAGTGAVERIATGFRWAEGRCISRPAATSCSATFPTTASCGFPRTTII